MGKASRAKLRATSAAPVTAASAPSGAWYVEEVRRGQQLLAAREVGSAAQLFDNVLARLGGAPTYARAVVLGQLGRCLHLQGMIELAAARLREAMDIARRLGAGNDVSALHASLLSEQGHVLRAAGRGKEARSAHEAALALAEALNDGRAMGIELSHLAALDMADGRAGQAGGRYAQALTMFLRAGEPALEALTRHQLGAVLQHAGQAAEAERQYLEAARLREAHGDLPAAATTWTALAEIKEHAGDARAAEGCYRKAVEACLKQRSLGPLADGVARLAGVLRDQPGRLAEARQLASQALSIARQHNPAGEQVWQLHGLLADLDDREVSVEAAGDERRTVLRAQARGHRHLAMLAPRILASLTRSGAAPSFGRAAILGGLGRCFQAAGQPELAAGHLRDSLALTKTLQDDSETKGLQCALHLQLGEVLGNLGRHAEAEDMLVRAMSLAQELQDLLGQVMALCHRATLALARGEGDAARDHGEAALAACRRLRDRELEALALHRLAGICPPQSRADRAEAEPVRTQRPEAAFPAGFDIVVFEQVTVEYAFEPDLLLDGRQERRAAPALMIHEPLEDDACPMLIPGSRSYLDEEGEVRFALPATEPALERRPGCIVMRRQTREVAVGGASRVLWKLVQALDGAATTAEIIARHPADDRTLARCVLDALAATGVVDVSGRPFGRYLHASTKKGVLPGGRLQDEQVRRLVGDGGYRTYEGAPRATLGKGLPEGLRDFHALTRARRSRRDYTGEAVSRQDFDALLDTACGVTGTMPWLDRELKMRAYPSSGGLYAVEIYPVVLRVEGLEPGVYHFRADENALEAVRMNIDLASFIAGALPVEREMVAGAATMVCLVGHFPRHEHKYGQGGYRMLVAEAGHISQMLVLAATALGLAARPFGGVFDDLVNQDLGLDNEQEQFLLAVLIGHAAG